jgi:hypothetical protein
MSSQKHFVIDMDYLNDLACSIAENIPEQYQKKFLKELSDYMKCATFEYESSECSSESGESDVDEEVYEVSINDDGFYELTDCDVKDCNAVGKEEKNIPIIKDER